MREATNLNWPHQPFAAHRRAHPAPILAAVTVHGPGDPAQPRLAVAFTYLRLHRTQPIPVTADTLAFGFHTLTTSDPAEVPALVGLVDRLLVQARRHAAILAGHDLIGGLCRLQATAATPPGPGIAALLGTWETRTRQRGTAAYIDTSATADGALHTLREARAHHRLVSDNADQPRRPPLQDVTARSLTIALIAAATRRRYTWAQPLDTTPALTRETWDQLDAPATTRGTP